MEALRPPPNADSTAGRGVGLSEARAHAVRELAVLPPALRALARAEPPYVVEISAGLAAARERALGARRQS